MGSRQGEMNRPGQEVYPEVPAALDLFLGPRPPERTPAQTALAERVTLASALSVVSFLARRDEAGRTCAMSNVSMLHPLGSSPA
jgi:hypothetical protein